MGIPTAEHLYKIKCSEERFCKFDCSIETNEHFLIHCKEYSDIEAEVTGDVTKDRKVVEVLSDNNDNKAKRKIALTILKKLKRRKKEVKSLMNKNKALVLYKNNIKEKCKEKYKTKEQRIKEFRERHQRTVVIEDLSRASVPYKVVERLSDNNDNKIKRKIPLTILKKLKRRKIEVKSLNNKVKTLAIYKNAKINKREKKYKTKELRIKEFRERHLRTVVIEDLSRALVPYKFKMYKIYNKARKRKKPETVFKENKGKIIIRAKKKIEYKSVMANPKEIINN